VRGSGTALYLYAEAGLEALVSALAGPDIEQLKDVVAQYGMDQQTGDDLEDHRSLDRAHHRIRRGAAPQGRGISCPDTFAHVPSALRHSAEGSAISRIETEPLTVTAYAVMIQRAAKTAGAALIEGELEKPGRTGAGALPGGK
jgi:hypothetical protein